MRSDVTSWIVDDDQRMRESLVWLLESAGYNVEAFGRPSELLEHYDSGRPGCLLLDLRLPEMNGLELWQTLSERGRPHPIIMISGHGDVRVAVDSIHQGALDFIEKPFDHESLLDRIDFALRRDEDDRRRRLENTEFQTLVDSLTPRETEVMPLVAEGMLTKQMAKRLCISEKTVEVHRSRITKKMQVQSVAQLVRLLTRNSMSMTSSPQPRIPMN